MRDRLNPPTIPARQFILPALVLIVISGCGSGSGVTPPIINQPPVATTACVSTPGNYVAGGPIAGTLPGSDPEGRPLIYAIPASNVSLKGSATTDALGNFTYTPTNSGVLGMDKFTYTVTDDRGIETTGTAWVFIGGTGNIPPAAVRIMPLGDSITAGITDGGNPSPGSRVGYRLKLYNDLLARANAKYAVDFVGQNSDGANLLVDTNHQGTPGQTDAQLASNISVYLNANKADILLLHIGTNAFTTSATDVEAVLNNIDGWEDGNFPVTVFLAKIIDDVPGILPELDVTTFNTNVSNMVVPRISDRVLLVDMQNGAGLVYGDSSLNADMGDNLHPKQQGYDKMATQWLTELTNPANVGPKFIGLPQCP